ncbi:MAG: hypothetical protein QOK06_2891 [Acidimicrobiaceae bacterium]
MRRGIMLVVGLLLASVAMPPPAAEARPLLFKILRGMTTPFGPMMGARRYSSRRAHHPRRAIASRTRPAAVAAAPAAAVAATGVATAAAVGTGNAPRDAVPATTGSAPAQDATAAASAPEPRQDETALPLPTPAPAQRNAALTAPDNEPQARLGAPDQAAPAAQPAPLPRAQFRLGTVGPLAWPTAYEDVIGFTLWPKEYGERLRVHGIGDVLATAFAPSASVAARMRANVQQARADEPNNAPAVPSCGSVDLTSSDWPIAQIASTIELTDAQRGTLDQLKTALSDAVSSIKSSCRNDADLAPVERLRVMQNMLWTVHDAAQFVRAPLAKFYDSLTEEQKRRFAAPEPPQAGGRTMSRSDMARMCDLPASADAPIRQIEQGLRPTKAQRASLELLQKKSFEMGQFLMASCLKPVPATPAERLDAASDRLTAVIFAISNVNIALNDFTSQLSDEQKTKLNSLVR